MAKAKEITQYLKHMHFVPFVHAFKENQQIIDLSTSFGHFNVRQPVVVQISKTKQLKSLLKGFLTRHENGKEKESAFKQNNRRHFLEVRKSHFQKFVKISWITISRDF